MSKFIALLVVLLLVGSLYAQNTGDIDTAVEETETQEAKTEGIDFNTSCMKIHGNYCGPGWCAGKWWGACDGGGKASIQTCPATSGATSSKPKDAVDSCCRMHDECCIDSRKPNPAKSAPACDQAIIACLQSSNTKCGGNWFSKAECNIMKEGIKFFFETRSKSTGC
jgi:hypothetical protein